MAAVARLEAERQAWRKFPKYGFVARPSINPDGSLNYLEWKCSIPGKTGTSWERGHYRLKIIFTEEYPLVPPKCIFTERLFHPNVYPSGEIYLPILDRNRRLWRPTITIKLLLMAIQHLLSEPNVGEEMIEAGRMYLQNREAYEDRVRAEARIRCRIEDFWRR